MKETLLTLICAPSLEHPITDWLLEQEQITGFTTSTASGHGGNPNRLIPTEQVEGKKKQVMFQIHLDSETAKVIINDLHYDFKGAEIHYWILPVLSAGDLSESNR